MGDERRERDGEGDTPNAVTERAFYDYDMTFS